MTYQTVLVHLSDPKRSHRLLEAAVPMVGAANGHLIGLSVVPPFIVIPAFDVTGGSVMVDDHRKAYERDAARLRDEFEQATRGQSLQADWREADASFDTVADAIIAHGRACDLIIASQKEPEWVSSDLMEDPIRLAMESGRPVLMVPNRGHVTLPPRRITVAWNDRREAARAAFDALPLLKAANDVSVLWINPEKEPDRAGDLPGGEICATLARHGVKCEATRATASASDVGGELLRQAAAYGSDLLVMGCYGHSRLREFVLGGASRHILAHAEIPVLLSH